MLVEYDGPRKVGRLSSYGKAEGVKRETLKCGIEKFLEISE